MFGLTDIGIPVHHPARNKAAIAMAAFFICCGLSLFTENATAGNATESDSQAIAHAPPVTQIYFALADDQHRPQAQARDTFDCSDKIYTVVDLRDHSPGRHQLTVKWIDPHRTTRETTSYPFVVSASQTRLWAWLSLTRGSGGALLQWINPAAGLEDFIGPWTVEVRVDGRKVADGEFEVNC